MFLSQKNKNLIKNLSCSQKLPINISKYENLFWKVLTRGFSLYGMLINRSLLPTNLSSCRNNTRFDEQGWRSGESACLAPMFPVSTPAPPPQGGTPRWKWRGCSSEVFQNCIRTRISFCGLGFELLYTPNWVVKVICVTNTVRAFVIL